MTRFRTMRRPDIFLLLFATSVGAELLVFNDTTGLPRCAYQCSELYATQYECDTAPQQDQLKCFCESNSARWSKGGWTGCNDVCAAGDGRERVDAWMEATCGSGEKDINESNTDPHAIISDVSPSEIESDAAEHAAAQAAKVREWWSRNYPFFVLAFLVVTIPIICYAIAMPLRRWCKRQLILRRPRSGVFVEDVGPYKSVFSSTGSRHSDQQYVVTTSSGPIPEHTIAIPEHTLAIPEHTIAIPQVATGPMVESSVRQDSWEARVRDQFESKKSLGERIKFWRK